MKKSAKGLLAVIEKDGELTLVDELPDSNSVKDDLLELVWKDGKFYREQTLQEIRAIVSKDFKQEN